MTHVSILVPQNTVLENSVVGLLKIFDLANHLARETGSRSVFELHFVGDARIVELYGGQFVIRPDFTLAEVDRTDLVIVPAMAGNIADAVSRNSAFIPWIQRQFRAGAEMAGLCTGVFFLADAGLIHEKYCSWRWFVDSDFRVQYTQINCLAHRAAVAAQSVHTEGAWPFFGEWLGRVAGERIAEACSAAFQEPFNAECQSVVSVWDGRRQQANRGFSKNRNRAEAPAPAVAVALLEGKPGGREHSAMLDAGLAANCGVPLNAIFPNASCASPRDVAQGSVDNHNHRTMKSLLRNLERVETSYANGQASGQNDR